MKKLVLTTVSLFLVSLISFFTFADQVEDSSGKKKDPQENTTSVTTVTESESAVTPSTGDVEAGSAERGLMDKAKDVYCSYVGLLFCSQEQKEVISHQDSETTQSKSDESAVPSNSEEVPQEVKN